MCCTFSKARLSNTILLAVETEMVVDGEKTLAHLMGYQNVAENLSPGPNAMILPFPAANLMGPHSVLDTSSYPKLLDNYAAALQRRTRSATKGSRGIAMNGADSVQVFDSGKYTIVLATNPEDIPGALNQVPEHKRPKLNEAIFSAYKKWYPNWPIALCCFGVEEKAKEEEKTSSILQQARASLGRRVRVFDYDSEDGPKMKSEPLLWWYVPRNPNKLFVPGLDAHDGGVPKLYEDVLVDHSVVFGSTLSPSGHSVPGWESIPAQLRQYLPRLVVGDQMQNELIPNGDFSLPVELVRDAKLFEDQNGMNNKRVLLPGA
jgi:hypothetical protein